MNYVSTRGRMTAAHAASPFSTILLEGLAVDGGLAVPERYPRFAVTDLARLRALDYRALAFEILSRFCDDIPASDLARLIDATYTRDTFGSDEIAPLTTLEPGLHLLHLSNGPTLAFKDIALQLLGRLFEYVLARDHRTTNILGATSGDTGSSAQHAMLGKRGIAVFMLSPHRRMSPFQQAQMYSLLEPAIHNLAIEGTFDDCQDI
ncbi:MAG TPA: threonine synthase, partial [Casimicrobiaceae bacterium]|nr:threonine synthase [Casimicrobiaceae bacterium]